MANVTVTNTADLLKAVTAARAGDTIFLASGTYSGVFIHDLDKSGVTITSADPNHQAILTDLTVKNASGMTFSNLEMTVAKDTPFQILSSSNIVLDHLDVHGSLDGTSNDDFRGMIVRSSTNVTVSNSHFHELTDALSHLNDQYLTITGNTFDTIRDDGIIGGGTSHVVVSNNSFTNFDHVGDVHPDAIQFFTTNTTTVATDITVSGNVYTRGTGTAVQGIWINDDVGTLPYTNLTVKDNVIVGAVYNGIVVSGAAQATVTGNTVLGTDGQTSWVGVRNVANATLTDNIATSLANINSNTVESGNVQATPLSEATIASYSLANAGAVAASSAGIANAASLVSNAMTIQTGTDAASIKAAALANVALLGFYDGASTSGATYNFTVATINGTSGADRLASNAVGSSHLMGLDGNDTLTGNANGISSTLEGGTGDDTYIIRQANDVIVEKPGEGTDTVYSYVNFTLGANIENITANAAGLTLHGNALDNTLSANAGGDTLYGEDGNDSVIGGAGNDILYGGNGNDQIRGNDGNDQLYGNDGNDTLTGGAGNDTLMGGAGNDTIEGGQGLDVLTGGKGADLFLYRPGDFTPTNLAASRDVITDFNVAEGDKIDLHLLDANVLTAKDDAFTFIANQAFHGVAGELRYAADGDGITIYGDTNGDKVADLAIHLSGVTTIASNSFVL